MGRGLYVETRVRADIDEVWRRTQDAADHTRWDLRFGLIEDVPSEVRTDVQTDVRTGVRTDMAGPGGHRTFRYSWGIGPVRVAGTGTTVGEHRRPDGTRTSALRFASPHPLSPLRRGSGWWRYVPTDDGVRFLTGYDYTPSWGRPGALLDRVLVRPLMGWATAWSFDRLRLWLERGTTPERSLLLGVADAGLRAAALVVGLRALRRGRWPAAVVAGLALVPLVPGAPRAGRCLRRPPDTAGRTAPDTLEALAAPA